MSQTQVLHYTTQGDQGCIPCNNPTQAQAKGFEPLILLVTSVVAIAPKD